MNYDDLTYTVSFIVSARTFLLAMELSFVSNFLRFGIPYKIVACLDIKAHNHNTMDLFE